MKPERGFQSLDASTKQPLRASDSPYLTSQQAIEYLGLSSLSALYKHIQRNRLPVLRAGGRMRFDRRELDAWLRGTTAIELVRARRRSA